MAKASTFNQPEEIDLRDAHQSGTVTPEPYYEQLVRVVGSTKGGTLEMFGILTGVSFARQVGDERVSQVLVYMEGQQHTVFDATRSGVWISKVRG